MDIMAAVMNKDTWVDVSAYQGYIDWEKVKAADIAGAVIRATTKNGELDKRFAENVIGARAAHIDVDFYKFMYSRTFTAAFREMSDTLKKISQYIKVPDMTYMYIDIETDEQGRKFTTDTAREVIAGAITACLPYGIQPAIYCNRDYLLNVIPREFIESDLPFWLARYNDELGDTCGASVIMWQYTSKGKVPGINGNVDLSIMF